MAYRKHFTAEGLSEVSDTDPADWSDLVTLTVTAANQDASSDYILFWSGSFQGNAASDEVRFRITQDGVEKFLGGLEPKEITTPNDYDSPGGFIRFQSGGSPAEAVFKIQFKLENGAVGTARAKNGRLTLLKLGANDAYAESLTRVTTTSATYSDGVSVNFTPPSSGDYVILASMNVDGSVDTLGSRVRLSDGTNTTTGLGVGRDGPGVKWPTALAWTRTALSGSQTLKVQYASESVSNTAGFAEQRILALRVADFDAVYSTLLGTESAGTEATYQDALTLTQTTTANDHLQLAAWFMENSSTSVSAYTQFLADSTTINEAVREATDVTAGDSGMPAFSHVTGALTAASHTWKIQRKSETTSTTTRVKVDAALLVFDLGAAAGTPATLLDQPVRPFLHLLLR